MILRFPGHLLKERSLSWQLTRRSTVPPGQTGGGFVPMAEISGGGLWRAELNDLPVRTKAQVMTWRALDALLDAGAAQLVLPMCDKRYFPAPTINGARVLSYPEVSHDDGALFSDGSGYYQPAVVSYVAISAPLRATSLSIKMVSGASPQAGQYFSIAHPNLRERLYLIAKATAAADGTTLVTIRPPLREAVSALEALEFDEPACVMQVATPEAFKLELEQRKFGQPSIAFMESFDPQMLNGTRLATLPGPAVTPHASLDFSDPDNSQYVPGL